MYRNDLFLWKNALTYRFNEWAVMNPGKEQRCAHQFNVKIITIVTRAISCTTLASFLQIISLIPIPFLFSAFSSSLVFRIHTKWKSKCCSLLEVENWQASKTQSSPSRQTPPPQRCSMNYIARSVGWHLLLEGSNVRCNCIRLSFVHAFTNNC